jgi:hypothetical protein
MYIAYEHSSGNDVKKALTDMVLARFDVICFWVWATAAMLDRWQKGPKPTEPTLSFLVSEACTRFS